ncbi:MAG: CvpA family protein [Neisseriaceae bacterium]|nr:CvpA family protein [Neisseriaceae bacterium]
MTPTLFDIIALIIIAIFAIISVFRGFVGEVVSIARWVLGIALGWAFCPFVGATVFGFMQNRDLANAAAFLLIFCAVFVLMFALNKGLTKLVKFIGLGEINRLLGGIIGTIKGIACVTVAVIPLSHTPLVHHEEWQNALSASTFEYLGKRLLPYIPNSSNYIPNNAPKIQNQQKPPQPIPSETIK